MALMWAKAGSSGMRGTGSLASSKGPSVKELKLRASRARSRLDVVDAELAKEVVEMVAAGCSIITVSSSSSIVSSKAVLRPRFDRLGSGADSVRL